MAELVRVGQSLGLTSKRQHQEPFPPFEGFSQKVPPQHQTLAVWTISPNIDQQMNIKDIRLIGYKWVAAAHIFTMASTAATLNGCTGSGCVPGAHYATVLPSV